MQNSQLLLNNHYDMQPILLTVLAKLSVVTLHDIGSRCFSALTDMLGAGKEMQDKVIEVIRSEVIEGKLNRSSTETHGASLPP
jgi:hypothetical protein